MGKDIDMDEENIDEMISTIDYKIFMLEIEEKYPAPAYDYDCFDMVINVLSVRKHKSGSLLSYSVQENGKIKHLRDITTNLPPGRWEKYRHQEIRVIGVEVFATETSWIMHKVDKDTYTAKGYQNEFEQKALDKHKTDTRRKGDYVHENKDRNNSEPDLGMLDKLTSKQKEEILSLLKEEYNIEAGDDSEATFQSFEDLKIKYDFLRQTYPASVRTEIDRCITEYRSATSSEKVTYRRLMRYLINMRYNKVTLNKSIKGIRDSLNNDFVGQLNVKKQLVQIIQSVFRASKNNHGAQILIVGPDGTGKSTVAKSIMKALGIPYVVMNLSGVKDSVYLHGSARTYDKSNCSATFRMISHVGLYGGLLFDKLDNVEDVDCKNILHDLLRTTTFTDEFIEIPMSLKNMWLICTARSTKGIPSSVLDHMIVINMEHYQEEDKFEIAKKFLLPDLVNRNIISSDCIEDTVIHQLIREYPVEDNILELREYLKDIAVNANREDGDEVHITEENWHHFFSLFREEKQIRHEFVRDIYRLRIKYKACFNHYTPELRKRIESLFEQAYSDNTEDKTYAIRALIYLVNITVSEIPEIDIEEIETQLSTTHYGLKKVKHEVVKLFAANQQMKANTFKAILLDGEAGIGKTTIAKAISEAIHRPFIKISLNGIQSSEVLSGFSHSYKAADAGIILKGLAKPDVCSYSCVMLLDEIDKMATENSTGNPYAALHSLLDNANGFYDTYLDATIPTEHILFICTSNDKSKIPHTILDRLEIIELEGYSKKEKKVIATNYVLPKLMEKYHLENRVSLKKDALDLLVDRYCTYYGVRDIERDLESLIKELLVNRKLTGNKTYKIDEKDVRCYLGAVPIQDKQFCEHAQCGEATALAVLGNKGMTFGIQVVENPYGERLKITGLPKDSAEESIYVAITLVSKILKQEIPSIHVHMTTSGIEKSGPSAGVTIFAAIMSMMLKQPLPNVAFTGEIDIFGNVHPIGGAKLKLIAAENNRVSCVYLPRENVRQLEEDDELKNISLKVVAIDSVYDLLSELFNLPVAEARCIS